MNELLFHIFPNERFIDLGLYQFGLEHCAPAHSYDLPRVITICFIMFFPEQEHYMPIIAKDIPKHIM